MWIVIKDTLLVLIGLGMRKSTFPEPEGGVKRLKAAKDDNKYKCSKCLKKFKHRESVYRHQKKDCFNRRFTRGFAPIISSPLKKTKKMFNCEYCNAKFDRQGKLDKHLHSKHTNPTSYSCNMCSREFKRIDFYKKHIEKCNGSYEDRYSLWSESELENENLVDISYEPYNIELEENTDTEEVQEYVMESENNDAIVPDIDDEDNGDEFCSDNESLGEADQINMHRLLSDGLLSYLCKFKQHDYIFEILYACLGEKVMEDVQKWLYNSLGMPKGRFINRLERWMGVTEAVRRGRRPALSVEVEERIFLSWIEASIVTVDRRNGRDFVSMPLSEFKEHYSGIDHALVNGRKITKNNQGIEVIRTLRMVTTKTVKNIQEMLLTNENIDVSVGTVWKMKPFFVYQPSEREKLSCMCIDCLNTREIFNAVQRYVSKKEKEIRLL